MPGHSLNKWLSTRWEGIANPGSSGGSNITLFYLLLLHGACMLLESTVVFFLPSFTIQSSNLIPVLHVIFFFQNRLSCFFSYLNCILFLPSSLEWYTTPLYSHICILLHLSLMEQSEEHETINTGFRQSLSCLPPLCLHVLLFNFIILCLLFSSSFQSMLQNSIYQPIWIFFLIGFMCILATPSDICCAKNSHL